MLMGKDVAWFTMMGPAGAGIVTLGLPTAYAGELASPIMGQVAMRASAHTAEVMDTHQEGVFSSKRLATVVVLRRTVTALMEAIDSHHEGNYPDENDCYSSDVGPDSTPAQ